MPNGDGYLDELTGLTYRLARNDLDNFWDADAIVFWGDFLHMASYIDQTTDVLSRRMQAMSETDAHRQSQNALLLAEAPTSVFERTITFGTTLAFNSAADYRGGYGRHIRRFISNVHGSWFRDGYSARVAELMRAEPSASCFGSDAAYLAPSPQRDASTASGMGVFIGRSSIRPEALARVGHQLADQTGQMPSWLPWGDAPAMWPMQTRKRLRLAWPELELGRTPTTRERLRRVPNVLSTPSPGTPVPRASELFDTIAKYSFIVTDTYHLALNSWRIGTPAILLYEQGKGQGWDVNQGAGTGRDKRKDLYSQLDAQHLLLDMSSRHTKTEIASLAAVTTDAATTAFVHDRTKDIAARSLRILTDALTPLVA